MMDKTEISHSDLVLMAEKWLNKVGCNVVIRDPFRTPSGEQPDAIGWRSNGISIMVECKSKRSDFLSDRNKYFRIDESKGMGDWRVYFCPKGLIAADEIPDKWGLIEVAESRFYKKGNLRKYNNWFDPPFKKNSKAETIMMVSALRRLQIRGYFPEIYDGMI